MFIRDGRIVLSASMDDVGERFAEVMVPADKADAARALKPIDERQVFGKSVMLFDGVPRAQLATFGETRNPGIADLLGFTLTRVQPGQVECELETRHDMTNPMGSVHGGIAATLLELLLLA